MSDDLTKIRIMADYSEAYAWDQDGINIGLSYNFASISEIEAIEEEFIQWSAELWKAEDNDPDFNWEHFHERGVALAIRLNAAIPKENDIEICYQRPYEDPKGKLRDDTIALRQRKNG